MYSHISRVTKMSHLRVGKKAKEIRNGFDGNLKIYLLRVFMPGKNIIRSTR